jgi:hypothetical protein
MCSDRRATLGRNAALGWIHHVTACRDRRGWARQGKARMARRSGNGRRFHFSGGEFPGLRQGRRALHSGALRVASRCSDADPQCSDRRVVAALASGGGLAHENRRRNLRPLISAQIRCQIFARPHGFQRYSAARSGIRSSSKCLRGLHSADYKWVSLRTLSGVRPDFGRSSGFRPNAGQRRVVKPRQNAG